MAWSKALIVPFALISTSANPADFFNFDRAQFMQRLRAEIDRMQVIAPIPDFACGKPSTLRRCTAQVTPSVQITVSDTIGVDPHGPEAVTKPAFAAFFAGAMGKMYDVSVRYNAATGGPLDGEVADNLCVAVIRAIRPGLKPDAAQKRYRDTLRRAANKAPAAAGRIGEHSIKGKPDTLIISVDPGSSISCTITAGT